MYVLKICVIVLPMATAVLPSVYLFCGRPHHAIGEIRGRAAHRISIEAAAVCLAAAVSAEDNSFCRGAIDRALHNCERDW
jgi:hypothetical protein